MFIKGLLAGKRILVTGGGTGLGLAMAQRFAGLGATLVLCGRREPVLVEAAAGLHARTAGDAKVEIETCDVSQPDQVEAMFSRVWRRGALDVVVNNAAASFVARTQTLSSRGFQAILGPTLNGAAYCTLAAGRRWIEASRGGVILSILSTSVRSGRAFTVPSAMAKSGVQAMNRSLAVEWGPHGIRLVAIAPGRFATAGSSAQLGLAAGDAGVLQRIPLGREGTLAELADLAAFLVSDQAGYINGETVAIDGGAHLRGSGAEAYLHWTEAQWRRHEAQR